MGLYNYLSENLFLRASDILWGTKIYEYVKFLTESQYWSGEQISEFQNSRLRELIIHSYNTVPYYRKLFLKNKLEPDGIRTREDLKKLPVLTKEIIKSNGLSEFTSSAIPSGKKVLNSSSGSTGEPLFYYTTKDAASLNIAASIRGWNWMGHRLGDRFMKLSQNDRKWHKKLQDIFTRNLYLSTNPLDEKNFRFILDQVEIHKPLIIRSYPDPLHFIAQFRKSRPEYKYFPKAIATTGNTLYPEVRREIEEAFHCKVFDAYNCEGNATVFECPTHECYHSSEEYGISEILDETGTCIKNGRGRLISTDLWNFAHPFIRYDTQDLVETDDTPCQCGRSLLRINRIIGRENDILEFENGKKFIVHNFTGFFQEDTAEINRSVTQFQVIKRKDMSVVFKLVVNSGYNSGVADFIKAFWEKEMKTTIFIDIVDHIPIGVNGKRRFILNEQ